MTSSNYNDFTLWPHKEVYPHALQMDGESRYLGFDFAKAWLDRFHGYDYGAMTVWLMRGFGLPNIKAHNTDKHSFVWGLQTTDGYVIEIEPKLISISRKDYKNAFDKRGPQSKSWSKEDFANQLGNGVFTISKVKKDAPLITKELFNKWLDEFSRPIYIRDVGASVIGNIYDTPWLSDVGPGHESVLRGGERQASKPPTVSVAPKI